MRLRPGKVVYVGGRMFVDEIPDSLVTQELKEQLGFIEPAEPEKKPKKKKKKKKKDNQE